MQPFGVLKSIIYERKNNPINLKRRKKLWKIISGSVSVGSYCIAVSPAVLAAETLATQQTETSARENMQKILESVKQRVEIPSECSEFSSRTEEQYGEKVYNFTWNEKDGNKSVNITCTADGVITNYSINGLNLMIK